MLRSEQLALCKVVSVEAIADKAFDLSDDAGMGRRRARVKPACMHKCWVSWELEMATRMASHGRLGHDGVCM